MRILLTTIMLFIAAAAANGQAAGSGTEGTVSYQSSQNVYVKFESTAGIKAGDTLFKKQGEKQVPALIVRDLSSISCVCTPLPFATLKVSDKVLFVPRPAAAVPAPDKPAPPSAGITPAQKPDSVIAAAPAGQPVPDNRIKPKASRQLIHGYFGISSYTDFSSNSATNSQRMKYTFSLMAANMGNTNLSAEVYMTFNHSNQNWSDIQSNVFNGLKVYALNLNYDFGTKASLLLGRRISPKLSNMGANDGLMFELRFKPVTIGVIAGFRPDYTDYGFNAKLFQFGTYLYNEYRSKKGRVMQSTLAFINQTNDWKTDRRFLYLQHVNSLVKNLTIFGSLEMDLYKLSFNAADSSYTPSNSFNFTNFYISLNYRVIKQLSLSFSYSARQNVIYYETYKSLLDKLTDPQTLQGYMLQAVVRPVNRLAIGLTGAYRFKKADPRPSRNFYGYITYTQIPGIDVAVTGTVTILQTSYINGSIYGIGLSKDLLKGKLYAGLTYRYTDYKYVSNEMTAIQNVGEVNLTWRIWKRFSMSAYYEGTFEGSTQYNRIYAQLTLGF